MKKLIIIFGVFSIICVIISSVADKKIEDAIIANNTPDSSVSEEIASYTIKSENGRIVVYEGKDLLMKTSTAVNTLPKKDQTALLYGIETDSKDEMEKLLSQYCS